MGNGSAAGEAEEFAARHFRRGATAVGPGGDRRELLEVAAQHRLRRARVLQAGEVRAQRRGRRLGQGVDAPRALLRDGDERVPPQVGEMARDAGLRDLQDRLEVADAERPLRQQVQQAQAGGVAEAVVDAQQVHADSKTVKNVFAKANMRASPERHPALTGIGGAKTVGSTERGGCARATGTQAATTMFSLRPAHDFATSRRPEGAAEVPSADGENRHARAVRNGRPRIETPSTHAQMNLTTKAVPDFLTLAQRKRLGCNRQRLSASFRSEAE